MQPKGITRIVFFYGSIVLGFLCICLGFGLFFEQVPNEKMQTLSNFIPFAFGALGATKVSARYAEAKEQVNKKE